MDCHQDLVQDGLLPPQPLCHAKMKINPQLYTYCLVIAASMIPGCSGCWKKPELQVVNPIKYLEMQDDQQEEIWELIRIKGDVVGYRHTIVMRFTEEGEAIYQVTQEDFVSSNRMGEQMSGRIVTGAQQKRDGTFLLGEKVEELSGMSMVTRFQPDDKVAGQMKRQAVVRTTINPETGEEVLYDEPIGRNLPWKPETFGPFAMQFSLWEKPLVPDEQRTQECFDLTLEQMVTVELAAGQIESLLYNNRETNLLPISATTRIGENAIVAQHWMDANGNIVKTTLINESSPMEITLSTQEKAMSAKENAGQVNPNLFALVRVQGTIPQPRTSQKVEFRLHRINPEGQSDSTPAFATLFPASAFQTVKAVDVNMLDVTVTASSPEALTALYGSVIPSAPKETTVPGDLLHNEWIQSDSEHIANLAEEATESNYLSWGMAAELERFVAMKLRVSYKHSFASAAEVAETMQGDSAGYAVLLVAIARAKKIPSRIVAGLVYTDTNTNEGVMIPHFWSELYIDGHWHPFDATIGQGGADASRIVLARSNLADESLPALVAKILPLPGHLQVTIMTKPQPE